MEVRPDLQCECQDCGSSNVFHWDYGQGLDAGQWRFPVLSCIDCGACFLWHPTHQWERCTWGLYDEEDYSSGVVGPSEYAQRMFEKVTKPYG